MTYIGVGLVYKAHDLYTGSIKQCSMFLKKNFARWESEVDVRCSSFKRRRKLDHYVTHYLCGFVWTQLYQVQAWLTLKERELWGYTHCRQSLIECSWLHCVTSQSWKRRQTSSSHSSSSTLKISSHSGERHPFHI